MISRWLALRGARGATLIELLTAIVIGTLVLGILYMLIDAAARSRAVVDARAADAEQGRQALAWVGDRLRQAGYDPLAVCPEGLILAGSGGGFDERLAFRATIDEAATPRRRIYTFYLEDGTIWQETRSEDSADACGGETARTVPDPNRTALTEPIVETFSLQYFGADGQPATAPQAVRSVGITIRLGAPSTAGRLEAQTFQSTVTIRGP